MDGVYLDFNATTPLDPAVVEAIAGALESAWGNPSSSYSVGEKAKGIIESSRNKIARLINTDPQDIIFTSGGTESNNLAIRSAIRSSITELPHVITSDVEHDSVIKVLRDEVAQGKIQLSIAEVNKATGRLEIETLMSLLNDNTRLITVMHANNETGVVMPIAEIGRRLRPLNAVRREQGLERVLFHTDAAQTIGKISVDVDNLGVDYLTVVGHKFYGPRIGALYAKHIGEGTPVIPIFQGGGQERGFRPGTENTPMIAGLGTAASLVTSNFDNYSLQMRDTRDRLFAALKEGLPEVTNNFQLDEQMLPNTLSLRLPSGLSSSEVLAACGGKIFASVGAACHSHVSKPSGILMSSGLSEDEARRTLRLSVGRETSTRDIETTVSVLVAAVNSFQA